MQLEGDDIGLYKEYQKKHLPNKLKLKDYWAPDFNESAYPGLDRVDAMQAYLNELRPYANVLQRAAYLRQRHFELYLDDDSEHLGHRHWREGMNEIAQDAQDKLTYYTKVHEQLLTKAITKYEKLVSKQMLRNTTRLIMSVTLPEDERNIVVTRSTRVARPRISKAERKARKQAEKDVLQQIIQENEQTTRERKAKVDNIVEKRQKGKPGKRFLLKN